jgi:hypothetical protein
MAALAAGAVTVLSSWRSGLIPPRQVKVAHLELALTGQGGATNTISASVLGFTTILKSGPVQTDDNSAVYMAAPSYDGKKLFLYDLSNVTDATRDAPADITDTVRLVVEGRP